MRLLFTECKEDDAEFFRRAFPSDAVTTTSETLAECGDVQDVEVLSIQVHSRVDEEALRKMPRLRVIVTRSTGLDHVDVGAAERRGVLVRNVPDYGAQTVAEHTLLLLFAIARRLQDAIATTREGRFELAGLLGSDLAGKTAVVIGVGAIGERFARMAEGVGMRVLGVDPVQRPETGVSYVSLREGLSQAEELVLCCPLVEATRYLLNSETFAQLQRGCLLVNTARGGVVHAPSLLEALGSGIVAAAGLDVLEYEEVLRGSVPAQPNQAEVLEANRRLMSHPRVIVTPHMAFYTREALTRLRQRTVELIREAVASPSS